MVNHVSPCRSTIYLGTNPSLIQWNEGHADAIPYGQSLLLAAEATQGLSDRVYRADRARDIALSRTAGIDAALDMNDVDILLAPMGAAAKCTGKAGAPALAIPAGMDGGGMPFGVTLFSSPGNDSKLLAIGKTVDGILGGRRLPKL